MIIVLGSTGNNGREVVKALRASNVPVRAIARDPHKAGDLAKLGAQVVAGDLSDRASLRSAFEGGSALFLLAPVAPDQHMLELDALAVARDVGVARVVKLSAIGADPLAAGHFSRSHGLVESALKDSGLAWTIVRGAFFYSNLLFMTEAFKAGALPGHWENFAAAWVDPIDLAGVCAAALRDTSCIGQTLIATGPEAFTNAALAAKLSKGLGRQIALAEMPPTAYGEMLVKHGSPQWYADAEVALRSVVTSGVAAEITNVVPRLVGRPARSIEAYIDANRTSLV